MRSHAKNEKLQENLSAFSAASAFLNEILNCPRWPPLLKRRGRRERRVLDARGLSNGAIAMNRFGFSSWAIVVSGLLSGTFTSTGSQRRLAATGHVRRHAVAHMVNRVDRICRNRGPSRKANTRTSNGPRDWAPAPSAALSSRAAVFAWPQTKRRLESSAGNSVNRMSTAFGRTPTIINGSRIAFSTPEVPSTPAVDADRVFIHSRGRRYRGVCDGKINWRA